MAFDAAADDHTAISDAQVHLLLEEFTTPQIVELLIWISFEYAGQMFVLSDRGRGRVR